MLQAGDKVALDLGTDQNGNKVSIADADGRKTVLYFYPKDLTSGCSLEAQNLRDNYQALLDAGYRVVGCSVDGEASHCKFIAKYNLPFPLIADTGHELVERFGVWAEKKMYGRTYMGTLRSTFIISPDGVIERVIGPKEIKVRDHAAQILG